MPPVSISFPSSKSAMSGAESKKTTDSALTIDTAGESDSLKNPIPAGPRYPPLSPEFKCANNKDTFSPTSTPNTHRGRSASTGRAFTLSPSPLRYTNSYTNSTTASAVGAPSFTAVNGKPMLIKEFNSTSSAAPINHVLMDTRDDGSHANNSHFETDSTYNNSFANTAAFVNDPQMDEIIIQKYIAERNKYRAAEANNAMLQAHISDLNRLMENNYAEAEKERNTAFMKLEQQRNITESLEGRVKELNEKMKNLEEATEIKINTAREDAEKKVQMARDEAEIKVIGIRNEMMEVQKRFGAAKMRLDQESEKSVEFTKRYKAMELTFEDRGVQLEKEKGRVNDLEKLVGKCQNDNKELEATHRAEIDSLTSQIAELNDKLDFEQQKSQDFSTELKHMSYQFVENLEKLEEEQKKTKYFVEYTDKLESQYNEVKNKMAKTNIDLEEMARGFLETDELLTKEGEMTSKLSVAINSLNVQLHNEVAKSKALESRIATLQKSSTESSSESTKLKSFSKSLSDELSSVKKNLASVVAKSGELTKNLKQTKKAYEGSQKKLEESQRTNKSLATELADLKITKTSLNSEMKQVSAQLKESQEKCASLSKQLQQQTDSFIKLKAKSMQEKTEKEEQINEGEKKVQSLSQNLEGMIAKYKQQESLYSGLVEELGESNEKLKLTQEELQEVKEANLKLESVVEVEVDGTNEKLVEEQEKSAAIAKELSELEEKHKNLFNDLVETEDALMEAKEQLKTASMRLEVKDDEFKPIETMLRGEIEARDQQLREEHDKNAALSDQSTEMNKKCNLMYNNLIKAEERILDLEDNLKGLKNQITLKDEDYAALQSMLEKEKNGPHQRKVKVAKKMIQAEKTRYRALQKEVEAKDLIIQRMEEQSEQHEVDLKKAKDELETEREKRSTHSRRVLQELHQQLEDERKKMKAEKEGLQEKLRSEKSQTKSLSIRLRTLEKSTGAQDVSNTLKEYHEAQEQVKILTERNDQLQKSNEEKIKSEKKNQSRLAEVSNSLEDLTKYMDTMAQYCYKLEEEKKAMKKEIESYKNSGRPSSSTNNLFNLLEGEESDDDDDTVSGMSLSDFSIAQYPTPRSRSEVMNRLSTVLSTSAENLMLTSDEETELTLDSNHRINKARDR